MIKKFIKKAVLFSGRCLLVAVLLNSSLPSAAIAQTNYLDRFNGGVSAAIGKQPVDAATTANITLSGYQTIDTVSLNADYMRVLVKNQTDSTKNGIYTVFSSAWLRSSDFSGPSGTVDGQIIYVTGGSQAGIWQLTTSNPIQIDNSGGQTTNASNITFTSLFPANGITQALAAEVAAAASATASASSATSSSSSATAAASSASTASTQATNAASSASAASSSASAAATSATAAQNYATALTDTSTTTVTIATGSKTFTVSSGKQFASGQFISIVSNASTANYMHGNVTSYTGTTLVTNITDTGGSGSHSDWNISVSGSQGATGAPGAGNVSSVGLSIPGIFTITNSPVTSSGTLTATPTGTSGGIPYFSSSSALASSGALTAGMPVLGGGAGASPTVGSLSGNTTVLATTTGTLTNTHIAIFDASGNVKDGGAAPTSGIYHLTSFTSSGTFTTASNVTSSTAFKITVTGGGGGGGNASSGNSGSGGGGGGTAIYYATGLSASTGYTVTIGGAGTAGNAGGNSTIVIGATTVTGAGGTAGINSGVNITGGSATNGTINLIGGSAGNGASSSPGGYGGASFWGAGGNGGTPSSTNGAAGSTYGTGGGGGSSGTGNTGASGVGGIVTVEWVL